MCKLAHVIRYHKIFIFCCCRAVAYKRLWNWVQFIRYMSSSVRLSSVVCLSVTFVHPATQAIKIFGNVSTPFGTWDIYWLRGKILRRSSQGNASVKELNQRGIKNVAILDLSKAISRKRWKIGGKLLLMTNRKSHMSFRLVPNWRP